MQIEKSRVTPVNVEVISNHPLDSLKVGDFYWVKFEDTKWQGDERVKVGEHETLMCIKMIGSNYVGFTIYQGRYEQGIRIHFDEFEATCRHEPNWQQVLNTIRLWQLAGGFTLIVHTMNNIRTVLTPIILEGDTKSLQNAVGTPIVCQDGARWMRSSGMVRLSR